MLCMCAMCIKNDLHWNGRFFYFNIFYQHTGSMGLQLTDRVQINLLFPIEINCNGCVTVNAATNKWTTTNPLTMPNKSCTHARYLLAAMIFQWHFPSLYYKKECKNIYIIVTCIYRHKRVLRDKLLCDTLIFTVVSLSILQLTKSTSKT